MNEFNYIGLSDKFQMLFYIYYTESRYLNLKYHVIILGAELEY